MVEIKVLYLPTNPPQAKFVKVNQPSKPADGEETPRRHSPKEVAELELIEAVISPALQDNSKAASVKDSVTVVIERNAIRSDTPSPQRDRLRITFNPNACMDSIESEADCEKI